MPRLKCPYCGSTSVTLSEKDECGITTCECEHCSKTWKAELVNRAAPSKVTSDGGGSQNYYDLPADATQLQDLIEYRNMNGNIKDIFKSCYRAGLKDGTSEEYDARKRAYYSLRELGRILSRKDYITLAKELIKHQAIEKD